MQVFRESKELKRCLDSRTAVTVGTFDGIHLGHRKLIGYLNDQAQKRDLKSVVVTFEPHPIYVLRPDLPLQRIVLPEEKIERLSKFGLDYLLVLNFNKKLANFTATQFFAEILVGDLDSGFVALGYNHTFGKNREGNFEFLKGIISEYDCDVSAVEPAIFENEPVSSSRIRRSLTEGRIEKANRMLEEGFTLPGRIVHGRGLGHKLGYPTINVKVSAGKIIPRAGVYAVTAEIEGNEILGMMYIHPKPELCDLEINLFNFEGEVYDQDTIVRPRVFTREAIKFDSLEDLSARLAKDEAEIKRYFGIS
jgi:riboflavin kinase/FMN adenylyltransferase